MSGEWKIGAAVGPGMFLEAYGRGLIGGLPARERAEEVQARLAEARSLYHPALAVAQAFSLPERQVGWGVGGGAPATPVSQESLLEKLRSLLGALSVMHQMGWAHGAISSHLWWNSDGTAMLWGLGLRSEGTASDDLMSLADAAFALCEAPNERLLSWIESLRSSAAQTADQAYLELFGVPVASQPSFDGLSAPIHHPAHLVGRGEVQKMLWELWLGRQRGHTEVALIHGISASGRTALLRWFASVVIQSGGEVRLLDLSEQHLPKELEIHRQNTRKNLIWLVDNADHNPQWLTMWPRLVQNGHCLVGVVRSESLIDSRIRELVESLGSRASALRALNYNQSRQLLTLVAQEAWPENCGQDGLEFSQGLYKTITQSEGHIGTLLGIEQPTKRLKQRIVRLFEDPSVRRALGVAALLGPEVSSRLWRKVLKQISLKRPEKVLRQLLDRRLVVQLGRDRWRYTSPAMRQVMCSFVTGVREVHLAVAVLSDPLAKAWHLHHGGSTFTGVDVLLKASQELSKQSVVQAYDCLAMATEWMAGKIKQSNERWPTASQQLCSFAKRMGRWDLAVLWAEEVLAWGEEYESRAWRFVGLKLLIELKLASGDHLGASELLSGLKEAAEGDEMLVYQHLKMDVLCAQGKMSEALVCHEQVDKGKLLSRVKLAEIHLCSGDIEAANRALGQVPLFQVPSPERLAWWTMKVATLADESSLEDVEVALDELHSACKEAGAREHHIVLAIARSELRQERFRSAGRLLKRLIVQPDVVCDSAFTSEVLVELIHTSREMDPRELTSLLARLKQTEQVSEVAYSSLQGVLNMLHKRKEVDAALGVLLTLALLLGEDTGAKQWRRWLQAPTTTTRRRWIRLSKNESLVVHSTTGRRGILEFLPEKDSALKQRIQLQRRLVKSPQLLDVGFSRGKPWVVWGLNVAPTPVLHSVVHKRLRPNITLRNWSARSRDRYVGNQPQQDRLHAVLKSVRQHALGSCFQVSGPGQRSFVQRVIDDDDVQVVFGSKLRDFCPPEFRRKLRHPLTAEERFGWIRACLRDTVENTLLLWADQPTQELVDFSAYYLKHLGASHKGCVVVFTHHIDRIEAARSLPLQKISRQVLISLGRTHGLTMRASRRKSHGPRELGAWFADAFPDLPDGNTKTAAIVLANLPEPVPLEVFHRACRSLHIDSIRALDPLLRDRWLVPFQGSVRFAHRSFRSRLRSSTTAKHHRALTSAWPPEPSNIPQIITHRLACGRTVTPLALRGLRHRAFFDAKGALQLVSHAKEVPAADLALIGEIQMVLKRPITVFEKLAKLGDLGELWGEYLRGRVAYREQNDTVAQQHVARLSALTASTLEPMGALRVGRLASRVGRTKLARSLLSFASTTAGRQQGEAHYHLLLSLLMSDEIRSAHELLEADWDMAPSVHVAMLNLQGEICRLSDDFDAAEKLYLEAAKLAMTWRVGEGLPQANLALVAIGKQDWAKVAGFARIVGEQLHTQSISNLLLLVADCGRQRWTMAKQRLTDLVDAELPEERDVLWCFLQAASLCRFVRPNLSAEIMAAAQPFLHAGEPNTSQATFSGVVTQELPTEGLWDEPTTAVTIRINSKGKPEIIR